MVSLLTKNTDLDRMLDAFTLPDFLSLSSNALIEIFLSFKITEIIEIKVLQTIKYVDLLLENIQV